MEHRLSGVLGKLLAQKEELLPTIATEKEEPKFIENMPADEYHADRTRMSSSALRKLLKSPREFLNYCSGLDDEDQEADHFRIGRAAHLMLLEPDKFREFYVVEPEFEGLTKDGKITKNPNAHSVKSARESWKSKQRPEALILKPQELNDLVGMIEAVLEHPTASGMLMNGKPECTIHWTDEETGIRCKARPDYIVDDPSGNLHLIDFKTTKDIREGIFSHDAARLKYYTQLAYYHDGLVRAIGRQPTTITIIAVEKKPPYEAAVYPLEDSWFEEGQKEYRYALDLYKKCRVTGKWPSYQNNAQLLHMPNKYKNQPLPEFNFGE